ncbi:MAG TPA: penicillin-binding protein 2 [Trebonia sp.]|nr:penicillin-binding protein 2 [Trebonia sp.]
MPGRPPRRRPRWLITKPGDPGRRLVVLLLAIAFILTLFGGRLVQLQGMESGTFSKLAQQEQVKTDHLPGVRGIVFDDTGHPLAMTLETFAVTADPADMKAAAMPRYATQLAGPLGLTSQQVLAMLQDPAAHGGGAQWMVLSPRDGVSATVSDEITALDIPGITLGSIYTPVYPDGDATLNVVGYATGQVTDNNTGVMTGSITGQAGIESQYNALLSGHDGSEVVYTGTDNEPIPLEGGSVTPATNGSDIKLTINSYLQYDAQQACEKQVKAMHARDCTVVIMQPNTGDILAMAQWPQYCTPALSSCASTTGTDLPVGAVFEPGSTAKVITAAAALEHGGQTPMSAYNIPYSITEGGQVIHDAEWHPGERYTIAGIIANSSNIGMAQVAKTITKQQQYQYLRAFGLGQPTGLGLQGEVAGDLAPPSQWAPDERYTLAYGQGIDVTALQMASVYATIANGGVRVQPRIVAGTTNPAGKYTSAPASPSQRVIKASTAHELIQILQQVPGVDESAGVPVGIIPGYAIASKTGTSNEEGPECPATNKLCEYGSSYIGMAPGNDPQVVVAVNVQDPDKADAYFGDMVAGPVFNQVMKFAVQTLQIPPDDSVVPNVRLNAP